MSDELKAVAAAMRKLKPQGTPHHDWYDKLEAATGLDHELLVKLAREIACGLGDPATRAEFLALFK